MVHAEVCVQMHAPMNTCKGQESPEHFFSITTLSEAESFMELVFQLGGPASCTVRLSSPQHWGCVLLSTKMLGIWSQVCLLSQLSILTSSALRCNFINIFLILFICVGGRERRREAEKKEGVSAHMLWSTRGGQSRAQLWEVSFSSSTFTWAQD